MSRTPRRADGSLRPSVRRYRAKRTARARKAWLANFKPDARERFFKLSTAADPAGGAVWLRPFAREQGLPEEAATAALEQLADERRWMKLRTLDGTVVGIAPPKRKPEVCT